MSTKKNENELYLVLQKKYFLEILKGEKKEEFRAFTDFYMDRLCLFNDAGDWVDVKKFDAVRFQLGYTKNAPQILVEFKEITLEVDEKDENEELNSENCNFVIHLGEILEKINCESLN